MVKLKFLGHACFQLSHSGKSVLFDPFLKGNPKAAAGPDRVPADLILVSHGHSDHLGDAVEISKRTGAPVFTTFELGVKLQMQGANVVAGNHGGSHDFGFAQAKITWAVHSSSFGEHLEEAGNPCGFVLKAGGIAVYHAGDTDVFGDMSLIGEEGVDVALLPIGGFFTMDARGAVRAVKMLKPKKVVPMHYNTFPPITADPQLFKKMVEEETSAKCVLMEPGQETEL
ncbi:MAG: metal-dependent hydrolase [Thermoprotei archaeon]